MKNLNPTTYVKQVVEAANFIRAKIGDFQPEVAITLGSGLSKISEQIETFFSISYSDIPNCPTLTVKGHAGEMIFGEIEGVPIVGLSGRKHYYEVADQLFGMLQVRFAVDVVASLGAKVYFSTNAVGGLNPKYKIGNLVVIEGHIGLFIPNVLSGTHFDFGDNLFFQPQDSLYNKHLQSVFFEAIQNVDKQPFFCGTYVCVSGRTFETAAEGRFLRQIGADLVGMSTTPEVIVAKNRGMKVIAISFVTNVLSDDGTNATSHEEVLATLNNSSTADNTAQTILEFFRIYKETTM